VKGGTIWLRACRETTKSFGAVHRPGHVIVAMHAPASAGACIAIMTALDGHAPFEDVICQWTLRKRAETSEPVEVALLLPLQVMAGVGPPSAPCSADRGENADDGPRRVGLRCNRPPADQTVRHGIEFAR
jgi:hypothetical protein